MSSGKRPGMRLTIPQGTGQFPTTERWGSQGRWRGGWEILLRKCPQCVSQASDGEGWGLALRRVGFIDLCLGLKPSRHVERKGSLWGSRDYLFDVTGVRDVAWSPRPAPSKGLPGARLAQTQC